MKKILVMMILISSAIASDYKNITLNEFADLVSKQAFKNIYIDEDINATSVSLYIPNEISDRDIFKIFKTTVSKKGYWLNRLGSVYYLSKKKQLKNITKLFPLKYDTSKDVSLLLEQMQLNYKYLTDSNTFLVTASPALIKQIENYINIIDIKSGQVKVKVMIFEYDVNNLRDIGIQFGSIYKDITQSTQYALNSIIASLSTNGISLTSNSFYSAIRLLEHESVINVKQYPYVLAKNNHDFKFEAVRNVAYLVTTTTTEDAKVSQQTSYEYKDVGLQIQGKVLTHKDYATLDLNLIVQDFVNDEITDTPQTYKRSLTSNTDLDYNKVLLISGLKRVRNIKNDYSIPYLSGIPILGSIFQYKTHTDEEINITIAIELIKQDSRAEATLLPSEARASGKER